MASTLAYSLDIYPYQFNVFLPLNPSLLNLHLFITARPPFPTAFFSNALPGTDERLIHHIT